MNDPAGYSNVRQLYLTDSRHYVCGASFIVYLKIDVLNRLNFPLFVSQELCSVLSNSSLNMF